MRTSILLSLIAIAALAGCNSSTSTTGSTQTPHTMTATINGTSWPSGFMGGGNYASAYASRYGSGVVTITGIGATNSQEIVIVLKNLLVGSVGTDSLGATTGSYAMYSPTGVPDTSTSYVSFPARGQIYSGSVTITAYDTTKFLISGTFQFVGHKAKSLDESDSVTVTTGSFYQLQFTV